MIQGDLGVSIFSSTPVSTLILQRLEPTLSLAILTMIFAVSVAVTLGVLAAWKAGRPVDRLLMGFSVLGFSMPTFVVGYCLIYVFVIELRWLPV